MNDAQFLMPHLEWEYSDFPIKVLELKFEKTNWGFGEDSFIEAWRDDNFRIRGRIIGSVIEIQKTDQEIFIGKGNIAVGQKITGVDTNGNAVELNECFLANIQLSSAGYSSKGYLTESELSLDNLKIFFPHRSEKRERFYRQDWFLCKESNVSFSGTTFRKAGQKKERIGLDEHDDSFENLVGSSSAIDYTLITLSEIQFIVAKVPKNILPDKRFGLCFEFRQNIERVKEDLISVLSQFISFLLGNKIQYIGYTLAEDTSLRECYLETVESIYPANAMPPIKFNRKAKWGDFTWLLNTYLPVYLKLQKVLLLSGAQSRYWISRNSPLGANLPVLASALEMLVEKYLSENAPSNSDEYMPKNEYTTLIEPVLEIFETGLLSKPQYEPIRNKILTAFRKGPNEKIRHFFSLVNLPIGKQESLAMALRNKMAHSSRSYSDDNVVHNDIIHTRVYEALFNRVILKLLGYDGYYVDYSLKGCPLKHIDAPAGESRLFKISNGTEQVCKPAPGGGLLQKSSLCQKGN